MVPADPQFARSEILRVFNHSQVYLFLGAAITTVGLIAAFFSLMRRRIDPVALWFALFAVLYGVRLELRYQMLWDLGMKPVVLHRLFMVIGFLIPIPAFFFFRSLKLLGGAGQIVFAIISPVLACLALITLWIGPRAILSDINEAVVSIALIVVIVSLMRADRGSPDVRLVRGGLFVFMACALFDNVTGLFFHFYNIEPFSFVVLLACLGMVAGRRAFAGEQQFTIMRKELEIAQEIQLSILPAVFPASKNFRVASRYLPMTSVAGDFYDFFMKSDHEVGLLIADVSGHGVPAALIASMVKLAATTQRASADRPAEVLKGMNNILYGQTQSQFVTAGYVYLNAKLQELRYSAAAHPPLLLLRRGEIVEIVENGLMLAAFDFATYKTTTLRIESGDRLLLCTDGVLEAANAHLEEFGAERLSSLVKETRELDVTAAADRIISSIQQWSAAQNDDLTILLCDYTA